MFASYTRYGAIAASLTFPFSGASAAGSEDLLTCVVEDKNGFLEKAQRQRLCELVSNRTNSRLVSETAFREAVRAGSPAPATRMHRLGAQVLSPTRIDYTFAFGTPSQWKGGSETRVGDLRIDVMDATLNETALSMLADTVKRLSEM